MERRLRSEGNDSAASETRTIRFPSLTLRSDVVLRLARQLEQEASDQVVRLSRSPKAPNGVREAYAAEERLRNKADVDEGVLVGAREAPNAALQDARAICRPAFSVACGDAVKYRSESSTLFLPENLPFERVTEISMTLRCYHLDETIFLQVTRERAELTVTGSDSKWVNGTLSEFEKPLRNSRSLRGVFHGPAGLAILMMAIVVVVAPLKFTQQRLAPEVDTVIVDGAMVALSSLLSWLYYFPFLGRWFPRNAILVDVYRESVRSVRTAFGWLVTLVALPILINLLTK